MIRKFLRQFLLLGGVATMSLALAGGVAVSPLSTPVFADEETEGDSSSTTSKYEGNIITDYDPSADTDGQGIFLILNIILTVLTFAVATAGVIGLVISGIMYMTSQGDPGRMKVAKTRIIEIVIGLIAYALLYVALNWLIPGGIGTIFS